MFETTHKLLFEGGIWPRDPSIMVYRVGTCHGQWFDSPIAYHILSIANECPGNGHLEDVFEWFERSCRRDHKALMVMDFFNERFREHCIAKRGFKPVPGNSDHLIKVFPS